MTILDALAARARSMRPADLPADVLALGRLQLVAALGAARASGAHPGPTLAARLSAAAARHAWDDPVLAGRVGLVAPHVVWALGRDRTLDELATALVVANEVGGRIGLAILFGPRAGHADTHAATAAGAAAAAWLRGDDATTFARAVAGAIISGRHVPLRDADGPALAIEASLAAERASGGPTDLLDPGGSWWAPRTRRPLHGAFAGLGEVWLTRTLLVRAFPGLVWGATALESVDEILRRHVKAADKRLRADQVERVELRVNAHTWAMHRAAGADLASALPRSIAVLVARHSLSPADLAPAALAERATEIDALAARVTVEHDWGLTLAAHERLARALGPLFGGWSSARDARRGLELDGGLPPFSIDDLPRIVRARPDRVAAALRVRPGDLTACDLDAFRWALPVEVRVHTTRGGSWPERRSLPLGTGAEAEARLIAPSGREALALARFDDATRPAARAALDAPGASIAADVLGPLAEPS